jgi:hypothetical protein
MARGGTGRWVARAAATGGGRTYRGQAPVRWYASLVLICLVGVSLVAYSKYEKGHPNNPQPGIGTHWYAALAIDICGKIQPNLGANPSNGKVVTGIRTDGDGVIRISPTNSSDVGAKATLARFVQGYPGLTLDSGTLRLPGKATHTNGQSCPAGTKDAGKASQVQIKVWPSFSGAGANNPVTVTDPSAVKLSNGQLITVAFVPQGASIPKPSGQVIVNLLQLVSGQSSTSTTSSIPVVIPSTTAPSSSSSTTTASTRTTSPTAPSTTAPSPSTSKP